MSGAEDVLLRIEGGVGRVTLNRPQALNALTTNMCQMMIEALLGWLHDPAVELVLLDHAGECGFCAGGDIRMLAKSGAGDGSAGREFFFTEYRLNHLLFEYPKPIAAVMDGITMGGGVGLSLPCRFRIASERTTFAMPETGIGLFPDVGGSWFLPRLPDRAGVWLALTGARLKAADCRHLGIATHAVASGDLEALKARVVADPGAIRSLLSDVAGAAEPAPLAAMQAELADLFGGPSVEDIAARLQRAGSAWAKAQGEAIARKSPQALKVTFRELELGRKTQSFAENMAIEYRIACRVLRSYDFLEGVRAMIVDKDNAPDWDPPALSEVTPALLDEIFAPLPPSEAWTPLDGAIP